ncbi:MAG: hypothetical protein H0V51_10105 [Chloroflexi bacterium]|nr:hypothetical protein [Chloroflexota bacterium]
MGLAELLPLLHGLNRADKLHVMQFLASELAREEAHMLKSGLAYPISSPYDAFEAADSMLEVLAATKETGPDTDDRA